jgi:hypothetical protein
MKRKLLIAVLALLVVGGGLWAADQSWNLPIVNNAGLNPGDVIVAQSWTGTTSALGSGPATFLTNSSRIRLLAMTAPTCPTYNQCGTGYTITGNDTAGIVTFGSVLAVQTTVTLTFNTPWASVPACIAMRRTGTASSVVQVANSLSTQVTFTISTGMSTGDTMAYHCIGTA